MTAHERTCRDCGIPVLEAWHAGPPAFWYDLELDPVTPADVADPADAWWPTAHGWTFGAGYQARTYIYRSHNCPGVPSGQSEPNPTER